MVNFIKESGGELTPPAEVPYDSVALGNRLREARDAAGITQTDWGTLMGRSSQAISNWEGGRATPPIQDLVQYATRLGADLHWLLTGQSFGGLPVVQAVIRLMTPEKTLQSE